ncbi:MAG: hypothetical protein ACRDZO_24005 [Egibacteraceae bacterium]
MVCAPRRARLLASIFGVALLSGLALSAVRSWRETPPPPPVIEEPDPRAAEDLKDPIGGLIDNRSMPPRSHLQAVQAFVIGVPWADLQPMQSGPIVENNVIDQALREIRRRNLESPGLDLKIKLRVFAGIHAPEWAKRLGGKPLWVTNPQNGDGGTVGRFWTDEFGRAYEDLQVKLANAYDDDPEIREVVISRCTTVFAEPFIRNTGDRATGKALLEAGFTLEADSRCHQEQIGAHNVWERTRSVLSLNPYQIVAPGMFGRFRDADNNFTQQMMRHCRAILGERCILQNNSLRYPPFETYASMYAYMRQLGPPIAFQTATREKIGELEGALEWAVRQGASSVEIFARYEEDYPAEALVAFDQELKSNLSLRRAADDHILR